MNYICFDIGGTVTKYAVVNNRYEILIKSDFPTEINKGATFLLTRMIQRIETWKKSYSVAGVAIASPGIVDCERGVVTFANERGKEFEGIDYKKSILNATDLACWAENDANCFALAETLHNDCDFLTITVGTGIGGAIMINGNVYHGINNSAGAFGQMRISDTEKWEEAASVRNLIETAKKNNLQVASGEELFSLYDKKNSTAQQIIAAFYHSLALGIVNLAYIFSPPKIIVGGGITNRPAFHHELTAAVKKIAHPAYFGKTEIAISRYKNNGGFIGALVNFQNKSKNRCNLNIDKV